MAISIRRLPLLVASLAAATPPVDVRDEPVPSPILTLDRYNFSKLTRGHKKTFVMFHAPWCGHCRRLEPIWESLAEHLHSIGEDVVVGMINAPANHGLARNYWIEYYPTLIFFADSQVYRCGREVQRTVPDLAQYVINGYRETQSEWAVLSWRILYPFNFFVDSIDDLAAIVMESHSWAAFRRSTRQCGQSWGMTAACAGGSILALLSSCFGVLFIVALCESKKPPPKRRKAATATGARAAAPPGTGTGSGTADAAARRERVRQLKAELAAELLALEGDDANAPRSARPHAD